MCNRAALGVLLGFSAGLLLAQPASALPDVTLWVVQPPGQLVAFDPTDFARIGGVRIPPVAYDDPSKLAVNGHGQILVQLDANHLWLWDGGSANTLPTVPPLEPDSSAFSRPGLAPVRRWLLGDDGKSLFVVEGATRDTEAAPADTSKTPLRMRETDLHQRSRGDVFVRTVGVCRQPMQLVAETEPCPDPDVWAPGGVVRGCAVLTHWEMSKWSEEPGLVEAAGYRTRYLRVAQGWRAAELDQTWSDELLDVSADGSSWVVATPDDGCCGWSNDCSDQTTFGGADSNVVVFDEWPTFRNKDYDVSFFTAGAHIGPDDRYVALSIHATEGPAADIPLSADGNPDSLELRAIRGSLAKLPMVLIAQARPHKVEVLRIPRAELIGWASRSEVLVVEDDHLTAIDVFTGHRRSSDIAVRTAADALVVWR